MSNKRVPIPPGQISDVLELLHERHRLHLRPGDRFTFEGDMSHGDIVANMTLADPEETEVLTLEARLDLVGNDISNPSDGLSLVMDLLDESFQSFFASGRTWRPSLDWSVYDFGESQVQMRGQVRNVKLDRMADALLAAADIDG